VYVASLNLDDRRALARRALRLYAILKRDDST
jgi:hypothetical protein